MDLAPRHGRVKPASCRPSTPPGLAISHRYGLSLRFNALDGGDGVLVDGRVKPGHDVGAQINEPTNNAIGVWFFLLDNNSKRF